MDAGGSLASFPVTTGRSLRDELATSGAGNLLDVRDANEQRADGRVPGAIEIPLGELAARLAEVPSDGPISVLCKSGSRASIAASVLDAAGYDVRLVGVGGAPELTSTR